MTISIIAAPAFSLGSFAWGAAAGVVGAPLLVPLLKNVIVRPIASLVADAQDAFSEAKFRSQMQLHYMNAAAAAAAATPVAPQQQQQRSPNTINITLPPCDDWTNFFQALAHALSGGGAAAPAPRARATRETT